MSESYSIEEVTAALNRAADDLLQVTDAGDEGVRDAVNLLVNAAMAYLTGEAGTLTEVAEKNYDVPLDNILGWIQQGVR
jgi:hypothetical protein